MNKNHKINYLYFDELSSTNDQLKLIAANSANFKVVYTFNQTNGRGYNQNKWIAEPNKNLTFSFLLNLKTSINPINLNFWVINCLHQFLKNKYLINNDLYIKWPNDLILNNHKIGGVLIENKNKQNSIQSVIGIGLNVNQIKMNDIQTASSILNETGVELNLEKVLAELMDFYNANFNQLLENNQDLINYYNKYLFKKDKVACFEKDNLKFNGKILNANTNGELVIINETDKIINFKHKEVKLLF